MRIADAKTNNGGMSSMVKSDTDVYVWIPEESEDCILHPSKVTSVKNNICAVELANADFHFSSATRRTFTLPFTRRIV